MLGGLQDVWRYKFAWAIVAVCFAILFARAFYLQVTNSSFLIEQGEKLITSKRSVPVYRGMITDTTGAPLAANAPLSTVVFSPYDYAVEYYRLDKIIKTSQNAKTIAKASEDLKQMDLVKLAATANFPLENFKMPSQSNTTLI